MLVSMHRHYTIKTAHNPSKRRSQSMYRHGSSVPCGTSVGTKHGRASCFPPDSSILQSIAHYRCIDNGSSKVSPIIEASILHPSKHRSLSMHRQRILQSIAYYRSIYTASFKASLIIDASTTDPPKYRLLSKHLYCILQSIAHNRCIDNGSSKVSPIIEASTRHFYSTCDPEREWLSFALAMHAANLVSLARLVTAPVIGGLIVNDYYSIAALAVAAAGVSDVLDGYLARKYQKVTTLGSILDPVADKVVINATAAALSAKGVLPLGLVGVFLARDSLLILGGAYFAVKLYREARRRDAAVGQPARSQSSDAWPYRVAPLFISKLNTFGQFCTISYASLGAAMGTGDDDPVLQALCWVVGSTTVLSGALYARAVLKAPSGYPSSILRKV